MATIIDLGKLRFQFSGVYNGGTTYEANDVVKYGGNVYVYKYGLATAGNLPTNVTFWDVMMEGFNFEGNYDSDASYIIGDAFSYGGIVYVTTANSVSGQRPPHASYSQFVDGLQYEGTWLVGTNYQKADIVTHGGKSYIALLDTTGDIPSSSPSQWDIFASGVQYEAAYSAGTQYQKGDIVTYGATAYIATVDTIGSSPALGTDWDQLTGGLEAKGLFDSAEAYVKNDLVNYGANIYRAKGDTTGSFPLDTIHWETMLRGFEYQGDWSNANTYKIGQTVTYGGQLYQALINNLAASPDTLGSNWVKLSGGFNLRDVWTTATNYATGDIVTYGGNNYVSLATHTSTTFSSDISGSKWQLFVAGIRGRGTWTTSSEYLPDDVVISGTSSYIALLDHTSTGNFATDLGSGNWQIFAAGGSTGLPTITANDVGKSIRVNANASDWELSYTDYTNNVFYVAGTGVDDSSLGVSVSAPFKTLNFCLDWIDKNVTFDSSSLVHVKEGVFSEKLPMTIPANTTIFGDGQRNTTIQPILGDSEKTMFFVNTSVLMKELKFQGLTGFVKDSFEPDNIELATVGGVYFRLDPTAVINKSPYIKECTAFSSGGIGALIDGELNNSAYNNGSMVFHTFTQVHSGGVGFWCRRNGKAEIVSCFTYYCDFGYATTGGGQIRALNGNNSYGTYGTVSYGFDSTEVTINGTVRGWHVDYKPGSLTNGEFEVGDSIYQPDRPINLANMTRSNPMSITTAVAHNLIDKDIIKFSGFTPVSWATDVPTASLYADVLDSFNINVYSNLALSSPVNSSLYGDKIVTSATITDILRSNPVSVTVSSHSFDSHELVRIQSVGGMTQINNRFFAVGSHNASVIKLKDAENSYISVGADGGNYTITGTLGGVVYSAVTDPAVTLYTGSRYYFDVQANGPFYLTSTNPASNWVSGDYIGEWTTGVKNSRAPNGSRLSITVDSSTPSTLYYASNTQSAAFGTITIAAPAGIDASAYSAYTAGGTMVNVDSGDDFLTGIVSREGAKATVIDVQTGANMLTIIDIIGTGFVDGDSIQVAAKTVYSILKDSDAVHDQYGFTMNFTGFAEKPKTGGSVSFFGGGVDSGADSFSYVIQTLGDFDSATGNATLIFAQPKLETDAAYDGQTARIRYKYSQARLTGHDFLNIGTGNVTTTNFPGLPSIPPAQGNEVIQKETGRVYYVSTDQDGNFRVGNYFRIDQATGRATLDATAFDLSGLTSLRLGSIGAQLGQAINEFSADATLSGNSNLAVPTEYSVKTYVDTQIELNLTRSLPKYAQVGGLATELYLDFDIKNLKHNL